MYAFCLIDAGYCKCKADGKQFQVPRSRPASNSGLASPYSNFFMKNSIIMAIR